MKKALLIIAAIALLAGPASAQVLSVWADEGMTTCEQFNIFPYMEVPVYMFLEPGPWGATAVEYMMTTPEPGEYFFGGLPEEFPEWNATLGGYIDGPCAVTFTCQNSTFWFVKLPLMMKATATVQEGYLSIVDNPDVLTIQIADCDDAGGRPKHPCAAFNWFGWNTDCLYMDANDEASWGAIKNMF